LVQKSTTNVYPNMSLGFGAPSALGFGAPSALGFGAPSALVLLLFIPDNFFLLSNTSN
jgi:hypothetical protein